MTLEPKKRRGAAPPTGREDRANSGTLCTATRRDGEQCTNFARIGMNVCRKHGGSAPQVIRKAQVRLLMASDRLMAQLLLIAEDKSEPTPVRLAAIRDALDRAGLGAKQQIEIEAKVETWETRVQAAVVDWGELASMPGARELTEDTVYGYGAGDEPLDATLDTSEREDEHRALRMAEVEATVARLEPAPEPTPPWETDEGGAQHATRLAAEHRRQAFAAEKASKGLTARTTRPRR